MGGRIRSVRNGRWLSRGKYVLLTHISNTSGGDPLVITPWLTNHNRDLETSLGLVNSRASPQLRAECFVNPTWTIDQYYTAPLTPGRRKGVTCNPSPASTQGGGRTFGRRPLRLAPLWGKPPVRGDTTPRHEPGTGRDQSRNTPVGAVLREPANGGGAAGGAPEVRRKRRGVGGADHVGLGRNGDSGPAYERMREPAKRRAWPRRRRGVRVAAAGERGRRQPTGRHAAVAARCARNGHSHSSAMIVSGDFVCMEGIICIGW